MNKIFLLLISFFAFGCSNFELVYKDIDIDSALKNNTQISTTGDLSEVALTHIRNILGSGEGEKQYELNLKIEKTKKKLVVTTGSIATKYRISILASYTLYNNSLKCDVFLSQKTTLSDFDSRADGYSFGTDTAEKNSELINLKTNINNFFSSLSIYNYNLECIDEN